MRRRKFVIGAGALFAGTAAATGTGAFSEVTTGDRSVNVAVAEDSNAFLGLDTSYDRLENSEYATENNGQLQLNFNADAGAPGGGFNNGGNADGLNPGSEYYFDGVFAIEANNEFNNYGNVIRVTIEENLDNPENIRFYWTVGDAGGRETDLANGSVGLSAGTYGSIGVYINVPEDESVDAEWETGSIKVKAVDVSPNDG